MMRRTGPKRNGLPQGEPRGRNERLSGRGRLRLAAAGSPGPQAQEAAAEERHAGGLGHGRDRPAHVIDLNVVEIVVAGRAVALER